MNAKRKPKGKSFEMYQGTNPSIVTLPYVLYHALAYIRPPQPYKLFTNVK